MKKKNLEESEKHKKSMKKKRNEKLRQNIYSQTNLSLGDTSEIKRL